MVNKTVLLALLATAGAGLVGATDHTVTITTTATETITACASSCYSTLTSCTWTVSQTLSASTATETETEAVVSTAAASTAASASGSTTGSSQSTYSGPSSSSTFKTGTTTAPAETRPSSTHSTSSSSAGVDSSQLPNTSTASSAKPCSHSYGCAGSPNRNHNPRRQHNNQDDASVDPHADGDRLREELPPSNLSRYGRIGVFRKHRLLYCSHALFNNNNNNSNHLKRLRQIHNLPPFPIHRNGIDRFLRSSRRHHHHHRKSRQPHLLVHLLRRTVLQLVGFCNEPPSKLCHHGALRCSADDDVSRHQLLRDPRFEHHGRIFRRAGHDLGLHFFDEQIAWLQPHLLRCVSPILFVVSGVGCVILAKRELHRLVRVYRQRRHAIRGRIFSSCFHHPLYHHHEQIAFSHDFIYCLPAFYSSIVRPPPVLRAPVVRIATLVRLPGPKGVVSMN
ncbi:hypothetical protein Trco_008014 [Trichoderma cornu-damae]|uniref:Uncharacterized protein n=1 Tax=Trichoderma cornu-damae TaxID=654480 RepID=A0A9P8QF25_9HYPO|nr:hypothetical protein Trco_008014 [Trichoderma cornu-damae]